MSNRIDKLTAKKIAELTKNRSPTITLYLKPIETIVEPFIENANTVLTNAPIYVNKKFDKPIGVGHHAFFYNSQYTGLGQKIASVTFSVKINNKGSFQFYHTFTDVVKQDFLFILKPNSEIYVPNIEGLTGEYTGKQGFGVIKSNKNGTLLIGDYYFDN